MLDDRDAYTPGWKFAEWELRGVPLRLEIGPKDIEKSQVVVARRDTREKSSLPMDGLGAAVTELLDEIQAALLQRALTVPRGAHDARGHLRRVQERDGRPSRASSSPAGAAAASARRTIKAETQATLRNIPFGSERVTGTCVRCGKPAEGEAWFAKAY